MEQLRPYSPGYERFRSTAQSTTGTVIKATPGNLFGLSVINRDSGTIYVKLYDKATAPTSSDTPTETYMIPVESQLILSDEDLPSNFPAGISVRVCTGAADSDNTAAATAPVIEARYV